MVGGVAAVAQRDQVGGVIHAAGGARDQVMYVGLTLATCAAAVAAGLPIAREDDGADGAPAFERCRGRGSWFHQDRSLGQRGAGVRSHL